MYVLYKEAQMAVQCPDFAFVKAKHTELTLT